LIQEIGREDQKSFFIVSIIFSPGFSASNHG